MLSMENTNTLSELGDWKDVNAYPNYRISSTGAFMNKRTLKILKHFRYEANQEPSVTLYRAKVGDVLSVESLLKEHFPPQESSGTDATLPQAVYKKHRYINTKNEKDSFLDD